MGMLTTLEIAKKLLLGQDPQQNIMSNIKEYLYGNVRFEIKDILFLDKVKQEISTIVSKELQDFGIDDFIVQVSENPDAWETTIQISVKYNFIQDVDIKVTY
jgi:hypothetical protein